LYWFSRLKVFKPSATKPVTTFSIIIPARNEEDNIENCIQSVLNNNYSKELFEIIVADDFSIDTTPQIVQRLHATFDNIQMSV
jgi:glycosyltransferase involved in cell wall biosynthesis